ncbi:alpha/beta fold hydrolase [Spirillospora sp. NPDC047279]|uniref:alpha/beta fold hydrolase n=1 Tax=Spirillospora sp. NPDC047279 TaxID=3155478 RepID=UPI0033C55BF9
MRTFEVGVSGAPTVVLPGLPVNADTWAPVVAGLGGARAVDLPGLGMSAGGRDDWPSWLAGLVADAHHLVGHSIGAAAAVEAAASHPGSVEQLTLVAPFFLQAYPSRSARWTFLTRAYLKRVGREKLAERLTGTTEAAAALGGVVADLRRGTVAATAARLLAETASPWRDDLMAKLRRHPGHVHVIVGSEDPLSPAGRAFVEGLPDAAVTIVPGAGHHPQLTHPQAVADAISARSEVLR